MNTRAAKASLLKSATRHMRGEFHQTSSRLLKIFDWKIYLSFFLILFSVSGCDHSSGGSSGADSGEVSIDVSPSQISTGTLVFLDVKFSDATFDDLDTQGLSLKLLVPNQLSFVGSSSSLTLDQGATLFEPLFVGPAPHGVVEDLLNEQGVDPVTSASTASNFNFIVFSLPSWVLNKQNNGHIKLDLNVIGLPEVPYIFADLDRGAISSFDSSKSDFDLESITQVEVAQPSTEENDN